MLKYPRTLYKSGGPKKWGKDKYYSETIVENEKDQEAAEKAGYVDSFQDALFPAEKEEDDAEMTKAEVMAALDDLGMDYNPRDKKAVLLELLEK